LKEERVRFLHSIQAKYAAIYVLVIAAVLILLNTYPILMAQDMVFESKKATLQSQTAVVASALAVSESLTADGVQQSMLLLEDVRATRILITDPAGLVLYDSSSLDSAVGTYALMGEVVSALRGNDVFRSEYRDNAFRSRAASPIQYRSVTIGSVYLYEYDNAQASLLISIQSNLRYLSGIIAVVATFLCLVFSRSLSRGIGRLLQAIRTVRKGEYNHRVEIGGHDELALLAGEFNQLTNRLQITENVRRRFVSDASHELKTPLASIRLLSDSILQSENMAPEMIRDFVSDIGEEAERLTRISEKLLTLTKLDAQVEVLREPVDVGQVVARVERMLRPLADAQHVSLNCDLRTDCFVSATNDEVYQVAFNLMENAVKYNLPDGEVSVRLRKMDKVPSDPRLARSPHGCILLEVADTGMGIPEEHRDKIFDRFYRVDKARSRAAGGTGLGLSIVRDTVQLHGGIIQVAPREGGGTRFLVTFPACAEPEVIV